MKDIRNLKIWPILEQNDFRTKEFRTNKVIFGRGAILTSPSFPTTIEVKPLMNGKWLLVVSSLTSSTEWTCNPFELGELLKEQIEKFKQQTI